MTNINSNLAQELSYKDQIQQYCEMLSNLINNNTTDANFIVGDINFSAKLLNLDYNLWSNYEIFFKDMVPFTVDNLINNGYSKIISLQTKCNNTLDHIYTNRNDKIVEARALEETLIKIRDLRKVDSNNVNYLIRNHDRYMNCLTSKEVNTTTENFHKMILDTFNSAAPETLIKNKNKKVSNEIKNLIDKKMLR